MNVKLCLLQEEMYVFRDVVSCNLCLGISEEPLFLILRMKIAVFCIVMWFSLVETYRCLGETSCFN